MRAGAFTPQLLPGRKCSTVLACCRRADASNNCKPASQPCLTNTSPAACCPSTRRLPMRTHTSPPTESRPAGQPTSQFDAQIAAIELANDGDLATRNAGAFKGCGVSVINPRQVYRACLACAARCAERRPQAMVKIGPFDCMLIVEDCLGQTRRTSWAYPWHYIIRRKHYFFVRISIESHCNAISYSGN